MQQTYQDRLSLSPEQLHWLNRFGALYGKLQRILYAHAARDENISDIKSAFCAKHGISARHFNALRIELAGKISATTELLTDRKKELTRNIKKTERTLKQIDKSTQGQIKLRDNEREAIAKLNKRKKTKAAVFNPARLKKLQTKQFQQKQRLAVQTRKLKEVEQRLSAPVPGICFGSRKLFAQQFHLKQTPFMQNGQTEDEAFRAWKAEWEDARSHQFFLVGSKDETAGNQSCKAQIVYAPPSLEPVTDPTLNLIIKMPQALIDEGAPAFIQIEGVHFNYGQANVIQALRQGVALSYRFHRDDHHRNNSSTQGWRVFVSTDVADAKIITISKDMGVLGVDFNADHLAYSYTDRFGNASNKEGRIGRIDASIRGKSSQQRDAILSNALDVVFAKAKKLSCPVAFEDLDFAAKKKELGKLGVKNARMLSGLAYSKYQALARAKAARLGVELIFVDPAYTSVAGSVNYAVRLGRTVHQAAAGVIARRAQGFVEKCPRRNQDGSTTIHAPLLDARLN